MDEFSSHFLKFLFLLLPYPLTSRKDCRHLKPHCSIVQVVLPVRDLAASLTPVERKVLASALGGAALWPDPSPQTRRDSALPRACLSLHRWYCECPLEQPSSRPRLLWELRLRETGLTRPRLQGTAVSLNLTPRSEMLGTWALSRLSYACRTLTGNEPGVSLPIWGPSANRLCQLTPTLRLCHKQCANVQQSAGWF